MNITTIYREMKTATTGIALEFLTPLHFNPAHRTLVVCVQYQQQVISFPLLYPDKTIIPAEVITRLLGNDVQAAVAITIHAQDMND